MVDEREQAVLDLMQSGLRLLTWSHLAADDGHSEASEWLRVQSRALMDRAAELRKALTLAAASEEGRQLEIP